MSETKQGPDYKIWYRVQYLNSICHICKSIPNTPIICPKCHLVTYCSVEHQEDDLDDHEELCEALDTVAKKLRTKHALDKAYLLGAEQLRDFRLGLISLCSKYMERQLLPWEMEVCLYPPFCATCHKFETDKLISCENCLHVKWCSIQHKPKNHENVCSQLLLYREILQKRLHVVQSLEIQTIPTNMDELPIRNNDKIEFCLLSEVATSPLTVLNVLKPEMIRENLNIHIVGAEPNFEANNLIKWEMFFTDLLPNNVKFVHLVFIGPEIGLLNQRQINKNGRKLAITFHQVLYHDYVRSSGCKVTTPNLIVALNPGLYRTEGYLGMDTWSDTISTMFQYKSVSVLITAYTEKEILLDYKRIKKDVKQVDVMLEPCRNPFSSQRPLMNFVSDEVTPVVYKNAYYTVLSVK